MDNRDNDLAGHMTKSRDLLDGALRTFARNGYARSSIVMIASEAGVSTRTIYNQYASKAELFEAVIEFSTRQMADHHIALVRASMVGRSLPDALLDFAERWVRADGRYADHHALVRQVQAEREHIPQSALDTWVTLGPLRVRAVLEDELRRLFAEAGAPLHDPATAATHLMLLIGGDPISRGFYRAQPLDETYLVTLARDGARTFLKAYAGVDLVADAHSR
ncbi:TetR/AcrR family transcriptional regulator [Lolliginicoccus levis]|uniref:TetR/AcrR family transcriptional regulator n=1 Tax=Lolliginicoccus levis TaxID=2919542 RepID=UPI00241E4E8A|nr:TetR/AcrR family transcriptional regulator [Lolliginicoccus levis]